MSCPEVATLLTQEGGRYLTNMIGPRVLGKSPWVRLVPRDRFPEGMNDEISYLTYEPAAPDDADPQWDPVITPTTPQPGGNCARPAHHVTVGSTSRSFSLYERILEGDDVCAKMLRTPFIAAQQMAAIIRVLTEYVTIEWEYFIRNRYHLCCRYHVVVKQDGAYCVPVVDDSESGEYPIASGADLPTSPLTQGVLDWAKILMCRNGSADGVLGTENGAPIMTAMMSWETHDAILRQDPEIRRDLHYGDPGELLKPLGVEGSYRGWFHVLDLKARRFTADGKGVLTQIAPYIKQAATRGFRYVVNPAYMLADYEETLVFNRNVMLLRHPDPVGVVAGLPFNPINSLGEWSWKNIPDRTCNPDGDIVFPRATLSAAVQAVDPWSGMAILHKVPCNTLRLVNDCYCAQ